jgi:hypothetical protein
MQANGNDDLCRRKKPTSDGCIAPDSDLPPHRLNAAEDTNSVAALPLHDPMHSPGEPGLTSSQEIGGEPLI